MLSWLLVTIKLVKQTDPLAWDEVVAGYTHSSPLQGWGFGEAREYLGDTVARFHIMDGSSRLGSVALHRQRLAKGINVLYAPRGPVFDDLEVLPRLLPAVKELAKPTDFTLMVEPPMMLRGEAADLPEAWGDLARVKSQQPEHTLVVELDRTEDELFEGLHKMARRNVRTSAKRGVVVGRDDDFDAFYRLFDETNERAQIVAFERGYYENMFKVAGKYGTDCYQILARSDGKALAGGFFLGLGEHTAYLYGGSVRDDRTDEEGKPRQDVKAPDAFYWESILDAKREGYKVLDLWGIPTVLDESKHSYGVYKMKMKFTEDYRWFPAYGADLNFLGGALVQARKVHRKISNYRARGTTDDIL